MALDRSTEKVDLGFGDRNPGRGGRLVGKDGTFNVVKSGRKWFRPYDFYHRALTMGWGRFLLLIVGFYFLVNCIFSLFYLSVGIDSLEGTIGENHLEHFLDAFFFSAQTITTLGYGRISPIGTAASVVAAIESLVGLLSFALITGLLYGRFSRPVSRIRFTKHMVLAPYRDSKAFMFRLANERSNELIELEVTVIVTFQDRPDGKRSYKRLDLELDRINFLSLSWTVVHPLSETSPLWGMGMTQLEALDAEFLIVVKGFDETFGQTVYQRNSYKYHEILWDAKFVSMILPGPSGQLELAFHLLDAVEEVPVG